MTVVDADKRTAELLKLAQRELSGETALSDEAGFARLRARLEQPRSFWSRSWLPAAVTLASAGALVTVLLMRSHAPAVSFQVTDGTVGNGGLVVGKHGTRIQFSDGSEARLADGAEAHVRNLNPHGADVVLTRGSMRVSIAKKPQAVWNVAAGPYAVRVTGTAFDVSWSEQAQSFDLRLETGAVIVTGPLARTGIPLKAGQHLFGVVAEGRLTVEGSEIARAAHQEPSAASPGDDKAGSALSPTDEPAPRPAADLHAWARQVAQGHFDVVLREAEQRGWERTLQGGSLEELSALADAARYAGRSTVAERVLRAERQRFPGSSVARDAAFFLGRIAEDSGSGAIEWYERYVTESPRGAYASQAFGRKMMLLYKQRGASAARPVATEYLTRYPNGPYAAAAKKLALESASPSPP